MVFPVTVPNSYHSANDELARRMAEEERARKGAGSMMGDDRPAPRRTLADLLDSNGAPPTVNPALPPARPMTTAGMPPAAGPSGSIGALPPLPNSDAAGNMRVGTPVPSTLSPLGKKMAEHSARSGAVLGSKVSRTPWGFEEAPPDASPSRARHAGMGALDMIALAGASGDPWMTAAAALTGAVTGGVSPRLVQKFQQQQELQRLEAEMAPLQKQDLLSAQIDETRAQAEQRRYESSQTPYTDPESGETYNVPTKDVSRVRETYRTNKAWRDDNAADNKRQDARDAETRLHHRNMEGKTAATEEITVAGRKFKVSPSTAARILEARTNAANKPSGPDRDAAEAAIEAQLEDEAGTDHHNKRREADEQAAKLRNDRADYVANGPGTKTQKAAKVADYDRQIAEAERESAYRQKEGDDAFTRRNKARSKSSAAPTKAGKSGRTLQGAIDAYTKTNGRAPTAAQVANMKAALER